MGMIFFPHRRAPADLQIPQPHPEVGSMWVPQQVTQTRSCLYIYKLLTLAGPTEGPSEWTIEWTGLLDQVHNPFELIELVGPAR